MLALLRKWSSTVWLCLMAMLAGYAVYQQPVDVGALSERIDSVTAAAALALIVSGKLLTISLVWFTLRSEGEDRGWRYAWRAYSLSDISKYLPGGIWGIASRIVLYRGAGIEVGKAIRALLLETALLIGFSFATGTAALLLWRYPGAGFSLFVLPATAVLLFAGVALLLRPLSPGLKLAATAATIAAWVAFGFSFALIASTTPGEFIQMAGTLNVAFAAGQLAVFAPSGIGIREFVVTWLGGASTGASARLLAELVIVHRLIWVVADFLVLLPALVMRQDRPAPSSPSAA